MKLSLRTVALVALVLAGTALAWDGLGLPNPLRIVDLIASGDVTAGDDATVGDDLAVTDQLTVSGFTAGRDAGFHNVVQSGNHFVFGHSGIQDAGANHIVASGTVSVTRLEFNGGGTPGLERGGNAIVQTSSGDNLAVLGTSGNSGSQSSWYVYASVNNPASGGDCSDHLSDFCVNDDLSIASSGTTGATITGAGAATFLTSLHVDDTNIGTCNAGAEGVIRQDRLAGGTTGARTRLCLCTSDGAGSPAYAWQNIISGTVGTSSVCDP